MKILVAEDSVMTRTLLETALKKWGYDYIFAEDGDEAWEILHSEDPPRIALLDWMMPKRNGINICQAIRAEDMTPYIFIMLLTAKSSPTDVVKGLDAGADDYITKPFNIDELRARIFTGVRIIKLHGNTRCHDRADEPCGYIE